VNPPFNSGLFFPLKNICFVKGPVKVKAYCRFVGKKLSLHIFSSTPERRSSSLLVHTNRPETLVLCINVCVMSMHFSALDILNWKMIAHAQLASFRTVSSEVYILLNYLIHIPGLGSQAAYSIHMFFLYDFNFTFFILKETAA
jgi:hypothetical protein